jgi:hypothetical protein
MPARTKKPKAGKAKGKKSDTSLLVDGLFSSREAVCEIRSGPPENEVAVKAEISVTDNEDVAKIDTVLVNWSATRSRFVDGAFTREETRRDGDTFKLDEAEAWITALYRAMVLAKAQGYLPQRGAQ